MRKRRGFFARYQEDESLDLIGIINCAGCPTLAAPEKILKRVRALAEYRLDALLFPSASPPSALSSRITNG